MASTVYKHVFQQVRTFHEKSTFYKNYNRFWPIENSRPFIDKLKKINQRNGAKDIWLIKTDANGDEEWNQTFGGEGVDIGYSVQESSDGGYIITGFSSSLFPNGDQGGLWVIKTDENGDIFGCNDEEACNYEYTYGATQSNCKYFDCANVCGGDFIEEKTSSWLCNAYVGVPSFLELCCLCLFIAASGGAGRGVGSGERGLGRNHGAS